jgi:hypothetical protein
METCIKKISKTEIKNYKLMQTGIGDATMNQARASKWFH